MRLPPDRLRPVVGSALGSLVQHSCRLSKRRVGVALMYHSVADRTGDLALELVPAHSVSLFEAQLRHLDAHFRLVPASELVKAVRRRRRGGRFPVAVTFDDDLRSHVALAMPLLSRLGVPATFFLSGASLDRPHRFWWELMQTAVDRGDEQAVREVVERHGGRPVSAERPSAIRRLAAAIEELGPADQRAVSEELGALVGPPPADAGLRAADVRTLQNAGFEIGFHTLRHSRLPPLDDEGLHRGLTEGRDALGRLLGELPALIAYPHGRADARVAAAARQAGFSVGFTSRPEAVGPDSDPLLLGRLQPSFVSKADFARQLLRLLLPGPGGPGGRIAQVSNRVAIRRAARRVVPAPARRWLRRTLSPGPPPVGAVRFGDLRRLTPISETFGFDRGLPVDRYYVEDFLRRHGGPSGDIRGSVLEVGDDAYTRRFGAGVTHVDVLYVDDSNPQATIVADLAGADHVETNKFDCVICTQTLLLIYDVPAAVATLERILKPGGVLLATVPGISKICRPEIDVWGDYWRFTSLSARRLFENGFPPANVKVEAYGNVLAATAFLHGLAADELKAEELQLRDPNFEVLIAVRAVRRAIEPAG
jgi:peptidoglycan/xylan/chitin deacetylase (PgdA/CDA1 family)